LSFLGFSWALTYDSFTGTRPGAVTAVLMRAAGVSVSVTAFGVTCLYRGDVGLSMALRAGSNPYEIGNVSVLTNRLSYVSGTPCPGSASMSGTFTMEPANSLGRA
jgi:hypothetical protein